MMLIPNTGMVNDLIKKRMKEFVALSVMLATLMHSCMAPDPQNENSMLYIESEFLKAGILKDVGGRVVWLSLQDKENILKSDPSLWNEPQCQRPEISPESEFKAYNGHIIWPGPQKDWWVQQNLNKERRREAAVWPPDPYLIYGDYTINMHKQNVIVMTSPESKISGLEIRKEVSITGKNTVRFEATGVNIRETPIKWDLWFNTRLDGRARFYVLVNANSLSKINANITAIQDTMRYEIINEYFTFIPQEPGNRKQQRTAKAFIYPDAPFIAAFDKGQLLVIRFEKHNHEEIHPDQALVEIYNHITTDPGENLLELEYHSPYKTIQPGDSIKAYEEWELYEYTGENTMQAHIEFLEKIR